MSLSLDIPDDFAARLETRPEEAEAQLHLELAVALYRKGQLPVARAASLAGLTSVDFEKLLRQRGVTVPYTLEDLRHDVADDEKLHSVTLGSIGDGVIVTDARGRVTFLNPEAERLTGWSSAEAGGRPLPEVFRIVNERSRQPADDPVAEVFRTGKITGLANHTVLISRNGTETPIDDSAAPIRQPDGSLAGVVLVFRDVAEQRKAHQTRAQLAAVVEFSGDAIFTKDLDGIIQTWNAGAQRLFGYRAEEIVGKPVTTLFPPDRLSEEDHILGRLRLGQPSERLETIRVAKDGRHIPVSVSVSPLKDADGNIVGASKVIHDITDLVAARAALAEEKELLATTLASIGDGVIVTDAQGGVTFLNGEAERLTGWKSEEAAGQPLPEVFRIINEHSRQTVENPVEKVFRLGTVVGLANHTVLIAKDGRETPIDDSGAPIRPPGGQLFGVVLVFRDFTERKQAENALRDAHTQLADRSRQLETLVQLRTTTLTRANEELQKQISERQGAGKERIARELRDQMLQNLTALSTGLQSLFDADPRSEVARRLIPLQELAAKTACDLQRVGIEPPPSGCGAEV